MALSHDGYLEPRTTGLMGSIIDMSTAYDVKYPEDMMVAAGVETSNWAESTIHSVGELHRGLRPGETVSFALWTFGIGFALGWKLKPW